MKNVLREARKERALELAGKLNALIRRYPGENLLLDTQCEYVVVDRPIWQELCRWLLFILIAFGAMLIYRSLLPKVSSQIGSQLLLSWLAFVFIATLMVCMSKVYDAIWQVTYFFVDRQYRGCCRIGYTKSNLEALDCALRRAQIAIEVYENRLDKARSILKVIDDLKPVIVNELNGSVKVEKGSLKPFRVKFTVNGEEACFDLEAKDALPQILHFVTNTQQCHASIHNLETASGGGC